MAWIQSIRGLVGIVCVLAATGCTNDWSVQDKQAPTNMLRSFSAPQFSDVCENASCITIQKKSLGKVFLLIASGITGGSAPQWYDLKPLVVTFEKNNSEVALLGENYNSIYKEIKSQSLVQTFKIVSEDKDTVTFDWGKGLKSLIIQSPYEVDAARGGKEDLTESSLTSIPVLDSFIEGIAFDEKNIEVKQVSKIAKIEGQVAQGGKIANTDKEETLKMNIQIRAYDLGSEFKPKEFDKSRRVGFFVTRRSKEAHSQDVTKLITKWDLAASKGPIMVRVTSAVPSEYLQSVVEAIAYWNKVFGQEVLVAKTNVDPLEGPENRSIIIRWVPWQDAGAAYALGQSDPLTGEVLRAQVFMPDAFTRVGSANLVEFNNRSPVLANGAIACDFRDSFLKIHEMGKEKSDSQRLRLAQDSVRATVAHELGHALGLRHNFAGSFSSKVSTDEILSSVKTYFRDLGHTGLVTSTSIMDYVSGVDEVLMSARIKSEALPYDQMAMKWAYSEDQNELNEAVSMYCTDDDIALANSQGLEVYGCQRFDSGNNPLRRNFLDAVKEKDNFVNVLFASILNRLYPGNKPEVVGDIDQILIDSQKWGVMNLKTLDFVSDFVMDRTKDGAPFPAFASLESVKSGNILYSRFGMDAPLAKQRIEALKEVGGFSELLSKLALNANGQIDFVWYFVQLEELSKSAMLTKGTTLAGREYELTPEQQAKILQFYKSFGAQNLKSLRKGILTLVPKIDEPAPAQEGVVHKVSSFVAQGLVSDHDAKVVTQITYGLLATSSEEKEVKVGEGLNSTTKVPIRLLSIEERLKYLPLLSKSAMRKNMQRQKQALRDELMKEIVNFVGVADPAWDLALLSSEGLENLPTALTNKGVIDISGSNWLVGELRLILALDKLN